MKTRFDDPLSSPQKGNQDERNRTILVCGVLFLSMVTLILYALTRDTVLLLTSGIVGTCILTVLRYYFTTG